MNDYPAIDPTSELHSRHELSFKTRKHGDRGGRWMVNINSFAGPMGTEATVVSKSLVRH
jgi:hypothetical protein